MAEAVAKKPQDNVRAVRAEAEAPAKPRADWLGIVIFSLVVINLASVGGMGYFMQLMWTRMQDLQSQTAKLKQPDEPKQSVIGKELQAQNLGTLYPIESFLVNIASDQGPKFLQTQMELELADPIVEDELSRKKPAIRDAIIVLLSSRSYKELREPAGMRKLRGDLLRVINNLLSTGKVKDIYFTQFHFN